MSIPDKLAAANKINEFLQAVVTHGGLRLKYRIVVDPPLPENRDWEKPEILVDFAGPDSALLLDRGGELLRALELLALEMLRLPSGEHEKISFDCQNQRSLRIQELRTAADRRRRESPQDRRALRVQPRCRRASAASCISPCATKPICAPKAKAKECAAAWWCIPRTTSRRERRARERCLNPTSAGLRQKSGSQSNLPKQVYSTITD